MSLDFEWDERKARKNLRDHGIAFEDAKPAFYDPLAVVSEDIVDEYGEQRYHLIGFVDHTSLLLVVHSYRLRYGKTIVRLISARKATPGERELYREAKG